MSYTDNQYKLNNFQLEILAKHILKKQNKWTFIFTSQNFMTTADKINDNEQKSLEESKTYTQFTARIINTCLSTDDSGRHWIIWVTVRNSSGVITQQIFFDSFGRKPTDFTRGEIHLIESTWNNPFVLQSNISVVCGIYVLYQMKLIEMNIINPNDIMDPKEIYKHLNREIKGKVNQRKCEENDKKMVKWLHVYLDADRNLEIAWRSHKMGANGGNDLLSKFNIFFNFLNYLYLKNNLLLNKLKYIFSDNKFYQRTKTKIHLTCRGTDQKRQPCHVERIGTRTSPMKTTNHLVKKKEILLEDAKVKRKLENEEEDLPVLHPIAKVAKKK